MELPINLTGGSYRHKSLPLSAQVTKNFWPQIVDKNNAKSPYVLESFVGLKLFSTIDGNADRGMLEHKGVLYKVSGEKLFSVDSLGSATELGDIPGGERCILEGINGNVVIVTGGNVYQWDGATITLATDVDLETPNGVAHLNNQMIFDGDDGRFGTSDVGDALSIDGLNYATAESNADDLQRVYSFNQLLYMVGDKTTENWYNSGVGNPPFDRLQGSVHPIGTEAPYSVASDNEAVYLLGHDRQAYILQGGQNKSISDYALTKEFTSYTDVSDATGWCMNLFGTWCYVLTFPIQGKTWVYPKGGEWFEWSSNNSRSYANSYAFAYGKHLVGDYESGNVYELDQETYLDKDKNIIRSRVSAPLHGGIIGASGKPFTINSFNLMMESGTGILQGQGSEPEVMLSLSRDGKTFDTEMRGKIGTMGEFLTEVRWDCLGQFESCIFKIQTSDPVYYSIHSAVANIEVGI